MADLKISQLQAASAAAGANEIPINEAGTTKKITLAQIQTLMAVPVKATGAEITTGTDDAKFATAKAIADATVGKLGAAWTDWTPTFTNMVVTSSTVTAKYMQVGKLVYYRLAIVLGGTNKPSGAVFFSLPVTSVTYAGTGTLPIVGNCQFLISSVFNGLVGWATTTTAVFTVNGVNGTWSTAANISATAPGTFAAGSELHATGFYEAA